ncbi:hypothetical protein TWF730_002244 [Orbilia blumenaviensis]|uniref:Uncharacterized protein n=1 Tax=Orbilia blumenaviensis TaxID=1796055 RepID=A0AAV9UA45_9PEZI
MRLFNLLSTALAVPVANADSGAPCTTTLRIFPQMDLSPTKTVFLTTVSAVNAVACEGCVLKTEYFPLGPGPVVIKTTTITVATTTEYGFRCQPTPA